GVQTCALPICCWSNPARPARTNAHWPAQISWERFQPRLPRLRLAPLSPPGSRAASSGDACSRQLPDPQTAPGEIHLLESQAAEALLQWRAAYPKVVEASCLGGAGPVLFQRATRVAGGVEGAAAASLHIRIQPDKQRIEQPQPLCRLKVPVAGRAQLAAPR